MIRILLPYYPAQYLMWMKVHMVLIYIYCKTILQKYEYHFRCIRFANDLDIRLIHWFELPCGINNEFDNLPNFACPAAFDVFIPSESWLA